MIDNLNRLGDMGPQERAQRSAECALMGHEKTGEQEFFATLNPIFTCNHCGAEFQEPMKVSVKP